MTPPGLTVRPMAEADAQYVVDLCNAEHAREFVHGPSFDEVVAGLARPEATTYIMETGGRSVGLFRIAWVGEPAWLAELRLIVVGEPGKGYGRAALHWVRRHAFEDRGVRRVYLEVVADNARARALYERCGFVQEGAFRDGFRAGDGTFRDLIPYGMLATEYRAP